MEAVQGNSKNEIKRYWVLLTVTIIAFVYPHIDLLKD